VENWLSHGKNENGNQDEAGNDRGDPNRASQIRYTQPANNEEDR
jgi:hypothetical protein